jgi:RND family efflux transporter MFP subunit
VESLATVFALQLRAERSGWSRRLSRVIELGGSRRKLIAIGGLLSAALMMMPLPDRIHSDCELQPAVRRFVAAPYAGIFQRSLVEPGDLIVAGEVLALMDDREVRWELTSVEAEQSRAAKSRDVNMAAGKVAAAQIDSLDVQRLELKRKQLLKRLEHLEVKSPISGIVVSGDLKRSEGMPATVGQVLYEIAPLNEMIAELEISDREIGRLREGAEVSLRLDAFRGQTWRGVVARIHPRSEVRETENVFIAEVELDNGDATLRPGMSGRATIDADSRAVWHVLVREPWTSLTRTLGW